MNLALPILNIIFDCSVNLAPVPDQSRREGELCAHDRISKVSSAIYVFQFFLSKYHEFSFDVQVPKLQY